MINIDYKNEFGFGHRSLVQSSVDRRKFLLMSHSIKDFLQVHVEKLESDWYMTQRGFIETYSNNPVDPKAYGSVTTTEGIKVTAHAYYNHLISEFDSVEDPVRNQDTYLFSYQI
jgi:hypothetical protein